MGRIIDLILKNKNLLVYLLFAFISLRLVFTYNYHHQNSFLKSSSLVFQSLTKRTTLLSNYLNLREDNDKLRLELALTKMANEKYQMKLKGKVNQSTDSLGVLKYEFQSARIVNKGLSHKKNFITLDKGLKAGVKLNDGIITISNQIVGKVIDVSDHFSLVMPVLHDELRVRVKLKNQNVDGILAWQGESLESAELLEIGKRITVNLGDSVVCSSSSLFFPEGVLVGEVTEVEPDGNIQRIKLALETDFLSLEHVLIVSNLFLEEQLRLESNQLITEPG